MVEDKDPRGFLPTRESLLSRLRNWDDRDSWRVFFETYWRLIYDVARQAGFNDAEAQDVVQETVVSVAGQIESFRYDASKGRFKNWLLLITRRRIADQLRKKYREAGKMEASGGGNWKTSQEALAEVPDPSSNELDAIWEREWQKRLAALAMDHVKRRVRADHYQIYELCTIQEWPATKVAKALGVTLALIYVTRHRIGAMLKKEIRRLEEEAG